MSCLWNNALKQYIENEPKREIKEATSAETSSPTQKENKEIVVCNNDLNLQNPGEDCCIRTGNECSSSSRCSSSSSNGFVTGASNRKIEICMGGKCKKFGAVALLEEFEREVGNEGTVVGCKCMEKCRNGPNVTVFNCTSGIQDNSTASSAKPQTNPLCIGVDLTDVGVIVANLLGKDMNDNCLMAHSLDLFFFFFPPIQVSSE